MKLIIISAVNPDGIIGINNTIPWHIPEDFKHYKDTTMSHTVIVGYNTYKSLPKEAFIGRTYLVLGGIKRKQDNVHFFQDLISLTDYIKLHYLHIDETIYIAGGERIYNLFIEDCQECIITWIDKEYKLDNAKLFPLNDLNKFFEEVNSTGWFKSKNDIKYKIAKYVRRNSWLF